MTEAALIRPARAADVPGVLGLWLDLIEYHRRLDPDYPAPPGIREVLRNEIERGLRARGCRLGVADTGTELVGFVFAEVTGGERRLRGDSGAGWIHELYVEPAQRRQGVATALLALACEFFKARGGGRISVRVENGNEDGLQFWLRRGFAERERILTR